MVRAARATSEKQNSKQPLALLTPIFVSLRSTTVVRLTVILLFVVRY